MGKYHINIPPDSQSWLFSDPGDSGDGRLWSVGRFEPKCRAGDDLFFKFGGTVVAAATVHEVYQPGLFDGLCHNGMRYLSGWKVTWLNESFIDLRCRFARIELACNDAAGMFTGKFENITFMWGTGLVELTGCETPLNYGAGQVKVARRRYPLIGSTDYVGNLAWNQLRLPVLEAVRMIDHLVQVRHFRPDAAPADLFDRLEKKQPLPWRPLLEASE